MSAVPTRAELLRAIARLESLDGTLGAHPGLSLSSARGLLLAAADTLEAADVRKAASRRLRPDPASAPERPGHRPPRELRVFSDGASRGNPGPAGAGAVLALPSGEVVERLGLFLGTQTNNHAEYMGAVLGLRRARALGAEEVELVADSQLLIRQLAGRYQVKSPTLRPLYEEARALLASFRRHRLTHLPREENREADAMSNRAIDERLDGQPV
ncbi:MAG: ribonuclease HI family protein [Myxococcaceae bacterium]